MTAQSDPSTRRDRERSADRGLALLAACCRDVDAAPDAESALRIVLALMTDESLLAIGDARALRPADSSRHLLALRGRRGLANAVRELQDLAERATADDDAGLDGLLLGLDLRGLRAPPGYTVDRTGIRCGDAPVAHYPIVVSAVLRDVATGTTRLSLSWRRDHQWTTRTLPRDEALDSRRVSRLALDGAPVSSASALELVRYLDAFEAHNIQQIPAVACSSVLGWVGESLLIGDTAYGPEGADPIVLDAPPAVADLLRAHRTHGTWEGWCEIVRRVCAHHPLMMLGIYAAVAAPLLERIGEMGFILDFSGETSIGKTTLARLAASVCGDPEPDTGLVLSWASASMVGPVSAAASLRHLPLILDETKRGRPSDLAACLYDLPAGRERMRGSMDGTLRTPRSWRLVTISTGEAPITGHSPDAGARARVLCLQGQPLSAAWEAVDIADAVAEHHGHLMPRIARAIVSISPARLRERYREERASLGGRDDGRVAGRLMGHVAVLSLARKIAEHVGCPVAHQDPIALAVRAAQDGGGDADRPLDAWEAVWSWAAASQGQFWGRHSPERPPARYVGQWASGSGAPLAVRREVVVELLDDWGFDSAGVIESWGRRGWLLCEPGRRTRDARIDGEKARCIVLSRPDPPAPPLKTA